jgi:prepilin-type N-terminal cleavage/methylation domain-containing protein
MKVNQKGFSVVEILIVIVVVGLLGAVGWLVYDRQKSKTGEPLKATTTTNSSTTATTTPSLEKPTTNSAKQTVNSAKQTVTYKTAKFSFDLPKDWTYSGAPSTMGIDEYSGYVVSPDKKLQLSVYIQKISDNTGSSVSSGPYQASFAGIGGKTYYLEEVSTNGSNVNQLSVSACGPNACKTLDDHTTKLNDTYWLNLAIDPGEGTTPPYKLSANDPLVTQIKSIISSIAIE